ncbi:MAG: PadR family transcriptional regulator [Ilumatobacteraceae bacterium]
MKRGRSDDLLLGEWACLGMLATSPAHGFALATRLAADGDVGQVWSLSRALTYRALDQLVVRQLVEPIVHERGIAGGNRTVFAPTQRGRSELLRWLTTPVEHLRDLRSELLLKLVLSQLNGVDRQPLLRAQRDLVRHIADRRSSAADGRVAIDDVVGLWRRESAHAALHFLDNLIE